MTPPKSGLPQPVMSALPPKADTCSALANVGYGPKADMFLAQKTSAKKFEHHGLYVKLALKGGHWATSTLGGKLCEARTDFSLPPHLLLEFLLCRRRLKCSI
jgi:hypothetical protein